MQLETALLVGVMFAVATYLVLQSSFVKILFGFLILTNAANLIVLAMSGRPDGKRAPVVLDPAAAMVDPLPQALVLTAIVITFGMTALIVVLSLRSFLETGADDVGVETKVAKSASETQREGAAG